MSIVSEAVAGIFVPTVVPKAPVRFIEDIWPDVFARNVTLGALSYHPGSVRFDEILLLAAIAKHLRPRRLFEIGTCEGRTTINIANNLDEIDVFFTLDLPKDAKPADDWAEQDRKLVAFRNSRLGRRFQDFAHRDKITQLYGDSVLFDFSSYADMDFVFIDANKKEACVRSDTINGWRMLRPGGVILWHDYGYCDGVTLAVDAFAHTTGTKIVNIHKTTLAVAVK